MGEQELLLTQVWFVFGLLVVSVHLHCSEDVDLAPLPLNLRTEGTRGFNCLLTFSTPSKTGHWDKNKQCEVEYYQGQDTPGMPKKGSVRADGSRTGSCWSLLLCDPCDTSLL